MWFLFPKLQTCLYTTVDLVESAYIISGYLICTIIQKISISELINSQIVWNLVFVITKMPDKKRPKVDSPSVKDAKKAKEDPSVGASKSFNYDPVHFIRSHSKNNDPADIQTQIWEVCESFTIVIITHLSTVSRLCLSQIQ